MDKIDWSWLSSNEDAIPMLEQNMDKINWYILSFNRKAVHLFEQNPIRIHWELICMNPCAFHLFKLDYPAMRERNQEFRQELAIYLFNPDRLVRMSTRYDIDMRSYLGYLQ